MGMSKVPADHWQHTRFSLPRNGRWGEGEETRTGFLSTIVIIFTLKWAKDFFLFRKIYMTAPHLNTPTRHSSCNVTGAPAWGPSCTLLTACGVSTRLPLPPGFAVNGGCPGPQLRHLHGPCPRARCTPSGPRTVTQNLGRAGSPDFKERWYLANSGELGRSATFKGKKGNSESPR